MNNIRYYINLIESINKKNFVGTCVNSFDEDGECIIPELPFNDVNDLAYADENAENISKEEFYRSVNVPESVIKKTSGNEIFYLIFEDVYMLYDGDEDIHYFFV